MDFLDCNTRARCDTCRHFTASGCALELALEEEFAPRQGIASGRGFLSLSAWTPAGAGGSAAES